MALNARNIKRPKPEGFVIQEAIEAGTYPARVVQVLDLGLQPRKPYKGQEKEPVQEVMITYELLDEFYLDEDGEPLEDKPRWLSETLPLYSLEVELAKSTKRYLALDPDEKFGGDFTLLVDCPCMVTVVQNPDQNGKKDDNGNLKIYNNVSGVSAMRAKEAARAAELVNPAKVFVLDEPDLVIYKSLPEWLQEKIASNLTFKGSPLQKALAADEDDDEEEEAPAPKAKAKRAAKAPVEPEDEDEDEQADGDESW
jgi:hypothetical protein